jgi:biopolymer transport protein ExbB/TolQ
MGELETFLHEITKFFLAPVLVVLSLMFVVALFYLGTLLFELLLRSLSGRGARLLTRYARKNPGASQEALELHLLKLIEPLRITSRVAPMLGLVATMIPMGPALLAVSSGDTKGIAANLVVAFSAVIVALLAAAIAFTVLSIRRRWLLEELNELLTARASATVVPLQHPQHLTGVAHG